MNFLQALRAGIRWSWPNVGNSSLVKSLRSIPSLVTIAMRQQPPLLPSRLMAKVTHCLTWIFHNIFSKLQILRARKMVPARHTLPCSFLGGSLRPWNHKGKYFRNRRSQLFALLGHLQAEQSRPLLQKKIFRFINHLCKNVMFKVPVLLGICPTQQLRFQQQACQ